MNFDIIKPLPFLNQGVAQIAIVVKDLEKSVALYERVFGIGPWDIYTYEKPLVPHMTYHGKEADHSNRLALSYFGTSRIELIEVGEGNSVYKDFVRAHGYGVQHLGFLVEEMQAAMDAARAAGFHVLQEGSGFGADGDGHYAYLDTEEEFGVTIELIERPRKKQAPEKVYP